MVNYLNYNPQMRPDEICFYCRSNIQDDNEPLVAHPDNHANLIHPAHRSCIVEVLQSGFHQCFCNTNINPMSLNVQSQRRNVDVLLEEEGIPRLYLIDRGASFLLSQAAVIYYLAQNQIAPAVFTSTCTSGLISGFALAYGQARDLNLNIAIMTLSGAIFGIYTRNVSIAALFCAMGVAPRVIFAPNNRRISHIAFMAVSLFVALATTTGTSRRICLAMGDSIVCYCVATIIFYIYNRIIIHRT